jgi:hypothetical protein
MALKGKPIPISTAATTIYTCPAGTEASVHGLIFSNNTGGALSVNVLVFNQADNTTVTVATGLIVPANQFITWTKPINLAAGDIIQAVSSAATGIVCLFSVFEGSAAPVAIGFTGRGEWSNVSSYLVNDIATVTGSGTFLALAESTNQDPTSNTAAWMFLEGISASALPPQGGQDGKFLTTDGTDASWAEVDVAGGAELVDPLTTDLTLTSANKRVQILVPTGTNRTVTLPVAGTLTLGESFIIGNKGATSLVINNSDGEFLLSIAPGKATKLLLIDTATADWEAYPVELLGVLQSITNGAFGATHTTGFYVPTVDLGSSPNNYQLYWTRFVPNVWRERVEEFSIDDNGVILGGGAVERNTYAPSAGSSGNLGYPMLNAAAFLDTGIVAAGGYSHTSPPGTTNAGRTALYENTTSNRTLHHQYNTGVVGSWAQPVAKVSNRKAITAIGVITNGTNDLNYRFRVLDYTSSLSSPTVGSEVTLASGGTNNPHWSDMERLEDNKGIILYNRNTGNTSPQFQKYAAVWTVSGTTPTIHTSIEIEGTNVNSPSVFLRVLSPTKAIAAWIEGSNAVARILTVSGNTLTAHTKFTLVTPPNRVDSFNMIRNPNNDDEFYVIVQNPSDNSNAFMGKVFLSGSTFLSITPLSKISPAIGINQSISTGGILDVSRANSIIAVFGGASSAIGAQVVESKI